MYLVDAKANAHVTSIASVSGGSLTNGFVGQTVNFREIEAAEFRKRVAGPLATQIAKSGTLFAPLFTKVYLLMLGAAGLLVLIIPAIRPVPWYVRVLLFFIGLAGWGWLFGSRGRVCARAFGTTLFSPNGRQTTLDQVKKPDLDHVICSTELRSAEQVYFSGDFVYSYALGTASRPNCYWHELSRPQPRFQGASRRRLSQPNNTNLREHRRPMPVGLQSRPPRWC
jgi:hypothetical protein